MEGVYQKEVEVEEEKQLDLSELIQPVPIKIGKKSQSEFSTGKKSSSGSSSKKKFGSSAAKVNEECNPELKGGATPFNMRKQAIETKRPALAMVVNPGQSMATISESRDEQNSTITSWYMQSA